MAYGLTTGGFITKPFDAIKNEIEDYEKQHIDPGLDFSDDSAISSINVANANQIALLWELAAAVYSSQYADTANDFSLVQVAALTGTLPNEWTKTTVQGRVTLNPNKTLPAGSVAHLDGRPSDRFVTTEYVAATPSGGVSLVMFEAEQPGPIDVTVGLLNTIAEPVSGWTAVNNTVTGTPGSQPETDDELRDKRERELSATGATNVDAIRAKISQVDTVTDALVFENDTSYIVDGLIPKSVKAIVIGGTDADVAQALFLSKAAGIDTNGSTLVTVTDTKNNDHLIRFVRAVAVNIYVTATISVTDDWAGAADMEQLKEKIAAYVNELKIGGDVLYDGIKCAIYLNDHVYKITILKTGTALFPAGTVDIAIGDEEYALCAVANINVTVI